MKKSKNLTRDIVIGLCLIVGVFVFMSGEFFISTMLFGLSSLLSNLDYGSSFRA